MILKYFKTMVKKLFMETACFKTSSYKMYMKQFLKTVYTVWDGHLEFFIFFFCWLLVNCQIGDFVKQAWQPCSRPLLLTLSHIKYLI